MGKKILIGITVLLITGLFTGLYFFTREAKYFGTSAFKAVPENVSVIVRIHHLGNYATRSLTNPIWKAYAAFPGIASLYRQLTFADSLLNTYPKIKTAIQEKDITILFSEENDIYSNLGCTAKRSAKRLIASRGCHPGA